MNRDQMLHVARAACDIAGVRRVLVAGSQAILGAYDESQLPEEAITSMEADVVILDDPLGDGGVRVDAAIGYMSLFHTTNGYYADGIEMSDLVLPSGWEGRLLELPFEAIDGSPLTAYFPSVEDLCAGKLGAGRPQDRRFVQGLVTHDGPEAPLVDLQRLHDYATTLDDGIGARSRALPLIRTLLAGGRIH